MRFTRKGGVWLGMVALAVLAAAAPVWPQAKPTVRVGYIPSDSFAALYIMADRYLPAADIGVETVRLAGGPEILSQVATGQLHVGGAGMGAAGFNAVASAMPIEFVAPLHSGYVEDYFTVRKASWEKEIRRIGDLKGKPVALNVRGAAVEWMLDQALKKDGLTLRDVQIKIMPFPDMVPALESGAVEAAILTEPFPTLAEERGIAVRPLPRPRGRQGHADHHHLLEQGLGGQGPGPGPQGHGGLRQGHARSRPRQRLEAGTQHRPDGQVHRRQSRRHPTCARPRARSESRYGFHRARLDAALEPGARLP